MKVRSAALLTGTMCGVALLATFVFLYAEEIQDAAESIVPSISEEVDAPPVGKTRYENSDLGYKVDLPTDWNINEIKSMSYTRFETFNARELSEENLDNYFKVEIVVLPASGLALRQWVDRLNRTSDWRPVILEQRDIEVAGHPALYQVERFGSITHPVVFVQKDQGIYLVNISANYERHNFNIEDFLNSFKFVEQP